MQHTIKLRKRLRSHIFDIVASRAHREFGRDAVVLGFIDPIAHTYKVDDDKVKYYIEHGSKVNKSLYFRLRHFKICDYITVKDIK